jgi:ariadne-1
MTWCPAPNCEYAIQCSVPQRSLDVVIPTVSCACSHVFCFGCGLDGDHRPCCCPIVKRWIKKCKDDSETSNWISANTKECTKCQTTIEKNGGCNVSFSRLEPLSTVLRKELTLGPLRFVQHMTCKKCKWVWFSRDSFSLCSRSLRLTRFLCHSGILLGLYGSLVRTRYFVVQLRSIRREG